MARRFSSSTSTSRPGSLGTPYAVYSEVLNTDKSAAGTKKRVRWLFGFSDTNEEHEVAMVHSLMSGKKTIYENGIEIVSSKGQLGQLEYAHSWNANAGPHVYRIESSLSFTSDHIYNFFIDGILFVNMQRGKSSGGSRNSNSSDYNQQRNNYSDSQATGRYSEQEYSNSSSSFNNNNTNRASVSQSSSAGFGKESSGFGKESNGFGKDRNASISQARGSFQSPEQLVSKSIASDSFDPFSSSPDQNNFDPFKNAPKSTTSTANRSRTSSSSSSAEKKIAPSGFGKTVQQKVDTSFDPFGENATATTTAPSPSPSSNQIDFFNSTASPGSSSFSSNANFDPFGSNNNSGSAPMSSASDILSTFAGMTVTSEPVNDNKPSESIINNIPIERVEEVNKDPWAGNLVDLNLGKTVAKASIKTTAGPSLSSLMGSGTNTSQPIMLNNNAQPVMLNNPPPAPMQPMMQPMMNAVPQQPMGMAAFSNPYESMQFPPRPMMGAPQQPMMNGAPQQPMMNGPSIGMMGQGMMGQGMMGQGMMGQGMMSQGMMGSSMMGGNAPKQPQSVSSMPAAIRPVDPFTNFNLPIKANTTTTQSNAYQSKPIQNSLDFLDLGLKK